MIRNRLKRGARRITGGLKRRLFGGGSTLSDRPGSVVSAPISAPPQAAGVPAPPAPDSPLAPSGTWDTAVAPTPIVGAGGGVDTVDAEAAGATDTVGRPMTLETVADLFEDMVRPALQSDGGDIDLVRVEDHDVYVRLTGACSTCPSSTVTMKMGIERLLVEEFPQFRNLIQVQGPA